MKKETISDIQGISLLILFIYGSTLVMGTGGNAKNDIWIAIMLAIAVSIPTVLMYARILGRYPGKDLYDILCEVFGNYAGKLFILFFIWFSFHLGALVLRNFGEFLVTVGLPETPKIVPIIIFALVCVIGVKCGIETLARCSTFFVLFVFFLLIMLSSFAIPIMKPENLLPILKNGLTPVWQGAFAAFTFPFGETVVFLMVFDSLSSSKTIHRVYLKALIISGMFIAFVSARNIMILGSETAGAVYFPSYSVISRVNIGNFLQRLEISVTIVFIIAGFIKICICLLAASKGVTKLFGFKDYRYFVTPVALLMVNLSYLLYDSIMEMFEWAEEIYPYYALPFQVILPLIILIAIEIKSRLQKKEVKTEDKAQV
ncbi:MAG TPA: endospore germination permease [Clostridia bacterium]|nr:endospore germination permease [Clostridia bacterium]